MIMWLITNCTCQHIHINLQQFLNIRIFASWVGACLQLPDLKLVHKSSRDYWIDLYCCFVDKTTQIILFCCNLSWSIEKCGTSSIEKSCNMQKDGCPSACKLPLMQWHLKKRISCYVWESTTNCASVCYVLTMYESLCNAGKAIFFAWLAAITWKTQQIRV